MATGIPSINTMAPKSALNVYYDAVWQNNTDVPLAPIYYDVPLPAPIVSESLLWDINVESFSIPIAGLDLTTRGNIRRLIVQCRQIGIAGDVNLLSTEPTLCSFDVDVDSVRATTNPQVLTFSAAERRYYTIIDGKPLNRIDLAVFYMTDDLELTPLPLSNKPGDIRTVFMKLHFRKRLLNNPF